MVRKKVVKKKIVRKKHAAAGPGPRSPRPPKQKLPGEGITAGSVIMLVLTLALIGFVVFVFLPRDISHIQGYPYDSSKAPDPPRNLLREAEDKLVKATVEEEEGNMIKFSEKEVNDYINQRLAVKQGGMFGSFVKMNGVYLDLEKDKGTLFVERKIFGLPFTVDTTWEIFKSDGKYVRNCTSSGVGRLKFNGAAFQPIMAPFVRFANALKRENKVLFDEGVRQIKLEKDALVIDYN